MFTVTGGTYAYFAFSAKNENTITGTAATTGLNLVVERKLPTNVGVMVPQLESGLGSAISITYSCIDGNNNTVCQVYKATITNNGTGSVELNGTIKFSGIDNMPNLKWKRITDERTIGEYTANKASTSNVIFDSNKVLTPNESDTYYFVIWIDETGTTQTDSGTFRVTIEFNPANGDGLTSTIGATQLNVYATDIMVPLAQSDASLNFTQTSVASNTNGVYIRSGTENNKVPIYYYRGNVNNNLIFADTCWKVVRTTETGGLKLLYNGVPSNGQCNNTGEDTTIGDNYFNENSNSPAYVGYMYGNHYPADYRSMDSSTQYVYGNGVNYSNGTYTLTNTKTATWSSVYESGLTNHHYTCFTTGTTCSSVSYIYNTTSLEAYYLTLTGGKNIETALTEMLDNNTTSSTIKDTIDSWYFTNIEQKGYSSYVEDTIWCNDRSIYSLGGFNPNGGSTYLEGEDGGMGSILMFSLLEKFMSETPTPNLTCSRNADKFTKDEVNGNGALDYSVGLLTADEIVLAGADTQYSSNSSYYLYNENWYWAGSPVYFSFSDAVETRVFVDGRLVNYYVGDGGGVRPSVSLKPGFSLTGNGDGSVTNPYVVE